MASSDKGNHKEEIEECSAPKSQDQLSLDISASRKTLLSSGNPQRKFPDGLTSITNRINFLKFGSASAKFRQLAQEKDDVSRSVDSSSSGHHFRERLSGLSHKLDWALLSKMFKEWIRDPMNMALFVWIMCVAISGAILFLVMTGMLNHALPKKSQRNTWFEVNNQILNALFTLMCLYQHPKRFYHLVLLCRWKPEDISRLRKIYCKNGTYKPHEWTHMMRSERPGLGVAVCISVAIAAPAIAGVYSIVSPLGRDYDSEMDEESQIEIATAEKKGPAQLSFCVFGWNMERLGFGNMYVHIATFILFCVAPFWIFNLAAVTIDNETVREALVFTGIILCAFGLLYGGFWRIQMRKRFNLPAYTFCFGAPSISDCTLWLCCCWCSLAQEVRTGNSYDIVEEKFCRKRTDNSTRSSLLPFSPKDGSNTGSSNSNNPSIMSNSPSPRTVPKGFNTPDRQLPVVREEPSATGKDEVMIPPAPALIEREAI
ncbi:hypothetical protein Tsubulata_048062 [Turnera subulata]|uniref:PLAC8 motif-containing protein n=1 Tax=Turnera subulata TaxID=218843 RepID=A0A9Q0FNX1_9ROSI|nr:hypothetical protein Tsubulata_048062 [Turnera subulata]